MKIALIGYGKMGKMIEEVSLGRNHTISTIIDAKDWGVNLLYNADLAIDFSAPESATSNIFKCLESNTPVVVGTTGWYSDWQAVEKDVVLKNGAILTATNFSIGVNIFYEINKKLASLMNGQNNYKAHIIEKHHIHKLDSPSGTAISIAEQMIQNIDAYSTWKESDVIDESVIQITSERKKEIPGTHEVSYKSEIDEIKIIHEANNRKGFALGAVIAAEFLFNKKGIYTMNDVLKL